MKAFTLWMALLVLVTCAPMSAQESADDLDFESESTLKPYKPKGKHYVFIRSKRGKSGVGTTTSGDSITSIPINEIVLVFTETNPTTEEARDEANKERWNNLIKTYPEYFQYSSTYMNLCQCNPNGDTAAFKKAQGFYIYYQSDEPVAEEAVAEPPAKEEPVARKEPEKPVTREEKKPAKADEEKPIAEAREADKPKKKKEEPVAEEPVAKPAKKEKVEEETPTVTEPAEEPEAKPVVKAAPKRKPAAAGKPRRAKDPKACRPACYGYGDEDLIGYFKDNITLTKKQKRKGKNLTANLTLQLNPDGTIKKAMVAGPNQDFNEQVQTAANNMGKWNAAVKNGVTIKSQVKMNLKFDKSSKTIRPSDVMVNPRPGPKCVCVSDEEIFGSD
jgi:hypothetical protein